MVWVRHGLNSGYLENRNPGQAEVLVAYWQMHPEQWEWEGEENKVCVSEVAAASQRHGWALARAMFLGRLCRTIVPGWIVRLGLMEGWR